MSLICTLVALEMYTISGKVVLFLMTVFKQLSKLLKLMSKNVLFCVVVDIFSYMSPFHVSKKNIFV